MDLIVMRFILLIFALVASSLAVAESGKTLRCVTTHYPPYTIFDEQKNTFTGSDIDLINYLKQSLGLNIKVIHLPWARVKKEMILNYYDCYFSLATNTLREKHLEFTQHPTHVTKFGLFALDKNSLNNEDFSHTRVAMLRGVALPNEIADKYKILPKNIIHSLSTSDSFKLLEKKRVDYVITNYQAGLWFAKNNTGIYARQFDESSLPVYIAFKPGVVDINIINEQIKRFNGR